MFYYLRTRLWGCISAIWRAVKRCFASRFISIVGGIVMSQTAMQKKSEAVEFYFRSFLISRTQQQQRKDEIFMDPQEYSAAISTLIGATSGAGIAARFSTARHTILPFNPD